jgi:diphthine-ammonia ligase
MRLVALVSGGKDSLFSALQCARDAGHDIVALANLFPPSPAVKETGQNGPDTPGFDASEGDELDSHAFQTVGHELVSLLAESCDLPLFRRPLTGTNVVAGLEYDAGFVEARKGVETETNSGEKEPGSDGARHDEVEDLFDLLSDVCAAKELGVEGVCSGAILSSYQRLRVENVCARLDLVSFAPLWQRSQPELLSEMVDSGLDAVLVKVSGAGLRVADLGRSLGEMQSRLHALNARFGLHVCGEGGEFETFVRFCPLIMKRRIVLEEGERRVLDDDDVAPVAYWRTTRASLAEPGASDTEDTGVGTTGTRRGAVVVKVPVPFAKTCAPLESPAPGVLSELGLRVSRVVQQMELPDGVAALDGQWSVLRQDGIDATASARADPGVCARTIFGELLGNLEEHGFGVADVDFVFVHVRDMADFSAVNVEFARTFRTRPPARALAATLNRPESSEMSVFVCARRCAGTQSHVLRVQSVSKWAPACIGPYSQARGALPPGATQAPEEFVAGQIGLDPFSMQLVGGDSSGEGLKDAFVQQLNQSVSNTGAILEVEGCDWDQVIFAVVLVDLDQLNTAFPTPGEAREFTEQMVRQQLDGKIGGSFVAGAVRKGCLPMAALCEVQVECRAVAVSAQSSRRTCGNFAVVQEDLGAGERVFAIFGERPTDGDQLLECVQELSSGSSLARLFTSEISVGYDRLVRDEVEVFCASSQEEERHILGVLRTRFEAP